MFTKQKRSKTLSNRSYQQQLAATLRSDLGLSEALNWCQEFGWDGVAQALLSQRDGDQKLPGIKRHQARPDIAPGIR